MMNGMFSKSSKRYADRLEKNILKASFSLVENILSPLKASNAKVSTTYNSSSHFDNSWNPTKGGSINERYVLSIGQEGPWGRTWYYIHSKDNPNLECVVDCIRMVGFGEEFIGRSLFAQISSGKEIGIKIDGYAIFIHPSQKMKRESGIRIDDTLLPHIKDMADSFFKHLIQLEPDKFDAFLSPDAAFV